MLFSWIWSAFATIFAALITALPAPSVPSWLSNLSTDISSLTSSWTGMGAWVPGSLVSDVLIAWAASYLIAITIRVIRMAASYLTGGGGSAA